VRRRKGWICSPGRQRRRTPGGRPTNCLCPSPHLRLLLGGRHWRVDFQR
jgi:hypothetical protein